MTKKWYQREDEKVMKITGAGSIVLWLEPHYTTQIAKYKGEYYLIYPLFKHYKSCRKISYEDAKEIIQKCNMMKEAIRIGLIPPEE